MTDPSPILQLSDAGHTPVAISLATGLPVGRVYATLRQHRPFRKRAPRRPTSLLPARVRGLAKAGIKPKRIATLCGVSAAYIYRILSEASPVVPPPPPY